MHGRIRVKDIQPQTWANGLGSTREICSFDDSEALTPDSPRWRLSLAELSAPSVFSAFPSLLRTFIPVGGDCVLIVDGRTHEVLSGTPLVFAGDSDTSLVRLSSPCRAINLISQCSDSQMATLRLAGPLDARLQAAVVRIALSGGARFDALDLTIGEAGPVALDVAEWAFIEVAEIRDICGTARDT